MCLNSGFLFSQQKQIDSTAASRPASHDEPSPELKPLLDRGKQLRDAGQIDQAIATFNKAAELALAKHDSAGQNAAVILVSTAQWRASRYRAAVLTLQKAQRMAAERNDAHMLGAISGNLSTIYELLGDWDSATLEAEKAVNYLRSIDNPSPREKSLLINAFTLRAELFAKKGQPSAGLRDFDDALNIARSLGNQPSLQTVTWDKKGVALLESGRISEAEEAFKTALKLTEQDHDKSNRAFVEEDLAELEIQKRNPDYQLALKWSDAAFAEASPLFKASPQYDPVHVRARILLGLGNKSAALSEFLRAVNAADQWRLGALPGDSTNTQTVRQLDVVYADYAHLAASIALEKNDAALAANALEVLAQNRAASLRERLRQIYSANLKIPDEYFFKLAQLQSAQAEVTLGKNAGEDKAELSRIRLELSDLENQIGLKPGKMGIAGERNPRRNSLKDIQHTLGQYQVLLSISVGKDRSYLWALTGDKISLSALPGQEELTSKANSFKTAVRNGHADTSAARELSRALFAQLPADVWKRSEWMIVPDGPLLDGIPFSALPSPGDGKPLIYGRDIRFLPSELLLVDRPLLNGTIKDEKLAGRSFVGVSDPIYNGADRRLPRRESADAKSFSSNVTLARLVGSEREVESAAKLAAAARVSVLTGALATRDHFEAALQTQPEIVHFAVHVVSPPDQPQEAALALSLKNGFPELLTPEVISSFHVPGSLVVLSGCSSGQGKILPGVGLVGLSRAWLLAGADAVIVSDWPTPDDSGRFFSSFYSHFGEIRSGDTAQRAALALRHTQIDMLHGSGYQASPTFWAAFAVIAKE